MSNSVIGYDARCYRFNVGNINKNLSLQMNNLMSMLVQKYTVMQRESLSTRAFNSHKKSRGGSTFQKIIAGKPSGVLLSSGKLISSGLAC